MSLSIKHCWRYQYLARIVAACVLTACGGSNSDVEKSASGEQATASATRVQVTVAVAEPADINRQTAVTGIVEAFRKAEVAAEVSGRVVSRLVEPGDQVTATQKMLALDTTKTTAAFAEARARVAARKVDLASARSELARGKKLSASRFISKDDLDSLQFAVQRAEAELKASQATAETAARALADAEIVAPYSGSVEAVHVQEGDYVTAGMPAATVADFSRLRVRAGVTAAEAASLEIGGTALLSFDVLGTKTLQGKLQSVSRIAAASSGTYSAEIWLENIANSPLREGMIVNIELPTVSGEKNTVVPAGAVFRRDGRMHVFTVSGEVASLTPVTVGRRADRLVELLDGVAAGDVVVTDGQFALRDGMAVAISDNHNARTSGP